MRIAVVDENADRLLPQRADKQLTPVEAANLLGTNLCVLQVWRSTGRGPRHGHDHEGRIIYTVGAIDRWLQAAPWTRRVTDKTLAAARVRGRARSLAAEARYAAEDADDE